MMRKRMLPLLLPLLAVLGGCSSSGTVSGEVTYEGQAVEEGNISFLPADGQGPAAGGPIKGGQYTIKDMTPGPKLVKVEAVKAVKFAASSEEMAQKAAEARKRGDRSGLVEPADLIPANAVGNNAKVDVGRGSQTFDFHLTRPQKK